MEYNSNLFRKWFLHFSDDHDIIHERIIYALEATYIAPQSTPQTIIWQISKKNSSGILCTFFHSSLKNDGEKLSFETTWLSLASLAIRSTAVVKNRDVEICSPFRNEVCNRLDGSFCTKSLYPGTQTLWSFRSLISTLLFLLFDNRFIFRSRNNCIFCKRKIQFLLCLKI